MSQKFHRVDYPKHVPEAFRGLYAASTALHNGALGKEFLELVFLRVSQINGCAYCMDMHGGALRKANPASWIRWPAGATAVSSMPAKAPRWPGRNS